jgi:hypothetical protein
MDRSPVLCATSAVGTENCRALSTDTKADDRLAEGTDQAHHRAIHMRQNTSGGSDGLDRADRQNLMARPLPTR